MHTYAQVPHILRVKASITLVNKKISYKTFMLKCLKLQNKRMAPKLKMVTLNHIKHNLLITMLFTGPITEGEYSPAELMKIMSLNNKTSLRGKSVLNGMIENIRLHYFA